MEVLDESGIGYWALLDQLLYLEHYLDEIK